MKLHIFNCEIFVQDHSSLNSTESAMELLTNIEVAAARTKGKQMVDFQAWNMICCNAKIFDTENKKNVLYSCPSPMQRTVLCIFFPRPLTCSHCLLILKSSWHFLTTKMEEIDVP